MKIGGENGVSLIASSGSNFRVSFVVPVSSSGALLNLYRSTDGAVWEVNAPDVSCTLDANKICTFNTNHLSYFAPVLIAQTISSVTLPVSIGNGGGGGSFSRDVCPMGDYSYSYYDRTCGSVAINLPDVATENPKNSTIPTNIVATGNLDIYVKGIQTKVYMKTLNNAERIAILSSMNRYIDSQIKQMTDLNKKTILMTLEDRLNTIILALRQDTVDNVTVIPNQKKNSIYADVLKNMAGGTHIYRYVNTENILAVRSESNFKSSIVGYLLANQQVEVIAAGSNWTYIKAGATEGYIRTRLLRKTL